MIRVTGAILKEDLFGKQERYENGHMMGRCQVLWFLSAILKNLRASPSLLSLTLLANPYYMSSTALLKNRQWVDPLF
jgi:hypothetical protein